MLVALGGFTLLTDVDGGEPYFDDSGGPVKLPDFCVVARDGQQLLVEVKNVSPRDPSEPHVMSRAEILGLQRYGELMTAPVAVAHYWSAWNRWTLVRLAELKPNGKEYGIDFRTAALSNELSRFGDCMLGTRPPLTLILHLEDAGTQPAAGNRVQVKVTDVEIVAGGVTLKDGQELNFAWFLMLFGDWPAGDPQLLSKAGVPQTIELSVNPMPEECEVVERQGFGMVGMLSSMYSAMYNERTLMPEGEVRELRHEPDPGELAALIPDDYWDREDRALSIWRLHIEPPE